MRETLEETGVGIAVHLPFAIDPGSPFTPVREGIVREFEAGMDLSVDLGADVVVFHPSPDAWDLGWNEAECREFVHTALAGVGWAGTATLEVGTEDYDTSRRCSRGWTDADRSSDRSRLVTGAA